MDPVSLGYYTLICAVLSLAAPLLRGRAARFLAGALVGLAAAALLPLIRQALGPG